MTFTKSKICIQTITILTTLIIFHINIHANTSQYKTKLAAHRGGKDIYPENTLFAFQQTAQRWKDCLLEGDIQITADKVPVIIHDANVDRTTDGTGPVKEKTLSELKKLDAGFRFTTDGGATFPYRGQGITIPTLEEVLSALPDRTFLFEIKSSVLIEDVPHIVEPIKRLKKENQVYLASVFPPLIQKIRETAPQIKTCFTPADAEEFLRHLRSDSWASYVPPAQMLALNPNLEKQYSLTSDDMFKIKEKGIVLMVFTVNHPDVIRRYLQSPIDWILTDRPDLLAQIEQELHQSKN